MTNSALRESCFFQKTDTPGPAVSLDSMALLAAYFHGSTLEVIIEHGTAVADLALAIGKGLFLPEEALVFLHQAALLHDIGVCRVRAPHIGLKEGHPYITHGILGREILEAEGLPLHALVCERHIGVGLTEADIRAQGLPLPLRDMSPTSLEEEIICFSDLFYSKSPGKLSQRKSVPHVRDKLTVFGSHKVQIFDEWLLRFRVGL